MPCVFITLRGKINFYPGCDFSNAAQAAAQLPVTRLQQDPACAAGWRSAGEEGRGARRTGNLRKERYKARKNATLGEISKLWLRAQRIHFL